tara:strand:+ start:511 stop:1065 length:555 start_codon:yes stop_codon:yes gene_type:complete
MKKISGVQDVYKFCDPDTIKIVYSKSETFQTKYPQTAIVLQLMGTMYYVGCVTPGTTSIDCLEDVPPLTMRAVPKLIRERLEYLAGRSVYTHPLAKRALHLSLAATPELEILNELEGENLQPSDKILPWGISGDAQKSIREVYRLHNGYQNEVGKTGQSEGTVSHEPEAQPFGGCDDGDFGKRA